MTSHVHSFDRCEQRAGRSDAPGDCQPSTCLLVSVHGVSAPRTPRADVDVDRRGDAARATRRSSGCVARLWIAPPRCFAASRDALTTCRSSSTPGAKQIDGYPLSRRGRSLDSLQFRTWHVMGPVRGLVDARRRGLCARFADPRSPHSSSSGAPMSPCCVSHPSTATGSTTSARPASYPLPSARRTPLVIAEIDQRVPRTYGTAVHELTDHRNGAIRAAHAGLRSR